MKHVPKLFHNLYLQNNYSTPFKLCSSLPPHSNACRGTLYGVAVFFFLSVNHQESSAALSKPVMISERKLFICHLKKSDL